MGDVAGQASILFHISQQLLHTLEGMNQNQNYYEAGFISHLKMDEKCVTDVILG